MANILRMPRWSPYAVGAGIGVLSWATFGLMGKALGTSTSMVGVAATCVAGAAPGHAEGNAYYLKEFSKGGAWKPIFDWQMALVICLAVGALIASRLGRTYKPEVVPSLWASRFGPSVGKRLIAAFLGGIVLIFGARLAGGCTSGHGISGSLQLAVSSWAFFISMFVSGVAAAALMFRTGSRTEVSRV